ncbi:MAG: preprotein translocase subunit SecE [Actinomycetota bacterium]|nr:preprotein translocase subunit SecE [Actinomycetota bacterium]
MGKATKTEKLNLFARIGRYFGDVRAEMKRVVWPTRNEVLNSSLVVIMTLAFFIAFTLVVDTFSTQLIQLVSKIGG